MLIYLIIINLKYISQMKGRPSIANIRTPIMSLEQPQKQRDRSFFIDEEFENIINKQCPGKLYKLIKQKTNKRNQTQPTIQPYLNNQNHMKVFERTFYKQRIKTYQKDQRVYQMRQGLKKILKVNKKPEDSFFQISRRSLLGLQRRSIQFMSDRTNKKLKTQTPIRYRTKRNSFVHPYLKISENTSKSVIQQVLDKNRQKTEKIIEFRPFGDIDLFDGGN